MRHNDVTSLEWALKINDRRIHGWTLLIARCLLKFLIGTTRTAHRRPVMPANRKFGPPALARRALRAQKKKKKPTAPRPCASPLMQLEPGKPGGFASGRQAVGSKQV